MYSEKRFLRNKCTRIVRSPKLGTILVQSVVLHLIKCKEWSRPPQFFWQIGISWINKSTQAPLFATFGFTAWKVQVYLLKRVRLNLQDLINIGVVTIMSFFKSAFWDTYCIVTSDTFGWMIYVFRVALLHFYPKHIQNFAFQNDCIKKSICNSKQ